MRSTFFQKTAQVKIIDLHREKLLNYLYAVWSRKIRLPEIHFRSVADSDSRAMRFSVKIQFQRFGDVFYPWNKGLKCLKIVKSILRNDTARIGIFDFHRERKAQTTGIFGILQDGKGRWKRAAIG